MEVKKKNIPNALIVAAIIAGITVFVSVFYMAYINAMYSDGEGQKRMIFLIVLLMLIFSAVMAHVYFNVRKSRAIHNNTKKNLSFLYETMPGGIIQCKCDGDDWIVFDANEGFYSFIGYSKDEFNDKFKNNISGAMYPPLAESIRSEIANQLAKSGKVETEVCFLCPEGKLKWAWLKAEILGNKKGQKEIYCILSDITVIKEMNQESRIFDLIKSLNQVIFFEWDIKTGIVTNTPNFTPIFDVPSTVEDFPYSYVRLNLVHNKDHHEFLSSFEEMKQGRDFSTHEYRLIIKGGYQVWYRNLMTTIFDENGLPQKIIGMFSDINEQKNKLERAEEEARRDPLTQLYNKKVTEKMIQSYLDSTENDAVLILLDIDNFKGINDRLGHLYGDAVLSELAHSLGALFRDSDIIGRIGGDEFIVFMTNIKDMEIVEKKANSILNTFKRSCNSNGISYEISCSIGISTYPEHGKTFSTLMEKADLALYSSKTHGKNQLVYYNDSIEKESEYVYPKRADIKEIEIHPARKQKNFRENIADYMLNIFYEYDDVELAVPVLLDFALKSYKVGRIDVSIFMENGKYYQTHYELCDENVKSLKNINTLILADDYDKIKKELDEDNIICCEDIQNEMPECFKNDDMRERGVKSILLCYVIEKGIRKAVLALEYFNEKHIFTPEEKYAMKTISNTISLFVLRYREQQTLIEYNLQQKNKESILDEMDEVVYVSDPETYELYYINKTAKEQPYLRNLEYKGKKCYDFIYQKDQPCDFCTNHLLSRDNIYIWEGTNPFTKRHYMFKDKLLEWNGKNARIQWGIDLTEKENQSRMLASRMQINNILLGGIEEMLSASSHEQAMSLILKRIGEFYKGDRSYILEMNEDKKTVTMTYEWLAEGSLPQINILKDFKIENSAVWDNAFRNRTPLLLEDISVLRDDFPAEYERIKIQEITAMYAIPFMLNGKFYGFLGIDSPRKYRGDTYILESIAYFVSNEIGKQIIREKIR